MKGANKIAINQTRVKEDLNNNPQLLAEPVQTVMKVFGEDRPYEKLKEVTRGKPVASADFEQLINSLKKVPEELNVRLKSLSCEGYTGLAGKRVDLDLYFEHN